MKTLLAVPVLLCLLTLSSASSAHGQVWPRNPHTGKVEFRGVLPWPVGVKTEAQRRALSTYGGRYWQATGASWYCEGNN